MSLVDDLDAHQKEMAEKRPSIPRLRFRNDSGAADSQGIDASVEYYAGEIVIELEQDLGMGTTRRMHLSVRAAKKLREWLSKVL
jgi:hypothetical protein